ncbi:MAG: Glu-tRNA(Gln) amidotransferase subunit GatD, partial [Candidatus ainarchaeum sp.]|nr:Glu-tRNA(Gln) amidotransferase subunit GatD [Candidatus ainarchaeum sp.]
MKIEEFFKKNKLSEGIKIEFDFENTHIIGWVMPSRSENLMIKLDSGYNAGFKIDKIKNIKLLGQTKKVSKAKTVEIKENKDLPTIALLHTGGTIASRVDYSSGGVYASFTVEDLAALFPELFTITNIQPELIENMMSEDMNKTHYQKISQAINTQLVNPKIKGIIVGHGTDTLGYSAAILSFMLKNVNKPVLIVGSQRSSDRGSSDAAMNLISAAEFITKTNFKGVAVCMHNSTNDDCCAILPGTKTRKMHTSRRDAFKAINDTLIALVDYKNHEIKWIKNKLEMEKSKGKFEFLNKFEEKVGLVKMHPGISEEIFDFYKNYKGLIIEGTGLGHTPIREDKFVKKILELIKSGCVVGMTSQCLYGRVHPNVYTNLRKLSEIGVIYCEDMLPETALMKLSWLLGNYSKEESK